jgi:hypothetical protein
MYAICLSLLVGLVSHAFEERILQCIEKSQAKEIAPFQAVMAFSCSTLSVPFRPIRSCFSPLNANT